MSERLLREMQDMRELLACRQPLPTTLSGADTAYEHLRQLMARVGFSTELSEEVLEALPDELSVLEATNDALLNWLREQLMARLNVLQHEESFDQTGIVALVGPTGAGKHHYCEACGTLCDAPRYPPVALVTTDSFRIGAHEQLRSTPGSGYAHVCPDVSSPSTSW